MIAKRLAVIAGAGDLPLRVAEAAAAKGRDPLIVTFDSATADPFQAFEVRTLGVGQVGALFELLRAGQVTEIVMAGKIHRPDFRSLKLDGRGLQILPGIVAAAARGDDRLIAHLVRLIESEGFRIVAPEAVLESLLTTAGLWTQAAPDDGDRADIAKGFAIARALGRWDIGQGVVIDSGLVLGLEAVEGTDAMLARVASLDQSLRRRGVLVKCAKPGQERRVDLPAIGTGTVKSASAAGLAGIAIEAGGSIVVDRAAATALADELGLFLVAMDDADFSDRG